METVAKLDVQAPVSTLQTNAKQVIPAATSPVAGKTSTGTTSTEGVDLLTFVVAQPGLHLIVLSISLLTASDAATSHFVRPVLSFTVGTGNSGITGVGLVETQVGGEIEPHIADADGAAIANSAGLDAKGGILGTTVCATLPISLDAGSTLSIAFKHTVTGSCTDGGTYRIGMAVLKL